MPPKQIEKSTQFQVAPSILWQLIMKHSQQMFEQGSQTKIDFYQDSKICNELSISDFSLNQNALCWALNLCLPVEFVPWQEFPGYGRLLKTWRSNFFCWKKCHPKLIQDIVWNNYMISRLCYFPNSCLNTWFAKRPFNKEYWIQLVFRISFAMGKGQ